MRMLVIAWATAITVVLAIPAGAVEPLVLYDDFSGTRIDANKWIGSPTGGVSRELIRRVEDGKLRMLHRAWGDTTSDGGGRFSAAFLNIANAASMTAIEATIRVDQAEATGCASNPNGTGAGARIQGNFFNIGTPIPNSPVGDVNVSIHVERFSNSAGSDLEVFALVGYCTNSDCSAGANERFDLQPVPVGQSTRVRMQWDKPNKRFIFQQDGDAEVFAPYTVSDSSPPGNNFKHLSATGFPVNCTSEPRPMAFADVFFDDVFVNESAAPANQLPIANAGPDQQVATGPGCRAMVTLNGAGSSDPDGDTLTYTWTGPFGTTTGVSPTVALLPGTHDITLTVDDGQGGTSSDGVVVTVADTTPPDIGTLAVTPGILWPPNHRMAPVAVSASAVDACGGATTCEIVSITSNEPINSLGDGDTAPDWQITGALTASLRAERSGKGSGRVYTVTIRCRDEAGNTSTRTVAVTVPHDQAKK